MPPSSHPKITMVSLSWHCSAPTPHDHCGARVPAQSRSVRKARLCLLVPVAVLTQNTTLVLFSRIAVDFRRSSWTHPALALHSPQGWPSRSVCHDRS